MQTTKLRPYFCLDLETTGLNVRKSQILQLSIVYDDGHTQLESLPHYTTIVNPGTITYGEPYALQLNSWIFKELSNKTKKYPLVEEALNKMITFIKIHSNDKRNTIAGKNVSSFDLPILKNHMNGYQLEQFDSMINHRTIDVGSMYVQDFGYNPCLDEINQKLNVPQVKHDALSDCRDVIRAIRYKMLIP